MSAQIVPIGKYKGQPVDVLLSDRSYSEWLAAQPWFQEKYKELMSIIVSGRAQEPEYTPEHNAMVARITEMTDSLRWLVNGIHPCNSSYEPNAAWQYKEYKCYCFRKPQIEIEPRGGGDIAVDFEYIVEVKPLIGDDYPAVIRQIKNVGAGCSLYRRRLVIAGRIETSNMTVQQVMKQFEVAKVELMTETQFAFMGQAYRAHIESISHTKEPNT